MTPEQMPAVAPHTSPDGRAGIDAVPAPAAGVEVERNGGTFVVDDATRAELDRRIAEHEADPGRGITSSRHRDVRRAAVPNFPQGVFRIDPDQITVLAVIHPKRDPAAWRSRA